MSVIKNITSTLVRNHKATHAMAVEKGDHIDCIALFKPEMWCMAYVIEAQEFLKSKGFDSESDVFGIRPCITWKMPSIA